MRIEEHRFFVTIRIQTMLARQYIHYAWTIVKIYVLRIKVTAATRNSAVYGLLNSQDGDWQEYWRAPFLCARRMD